MRVYLSVPLTIAALAVSGHSGAAAQGTEIGIWGGLARSNEVTTDFQMCNMNGCGPGKTYPSFSRTSVVAGLSVRQRLSDRIGIRVEAGVANKGFGPGDHRSDSRVSSAYLELPLLADLRLFNFGATELHLSAGVAPAVLLSCRWSGTTVNGRESGTCDEPGEFSQYGPTVRHDLGWMLAPGVRVNTGLGALLLELRRTGGLVDIQPGEFGRTANSSTAVVVGFLWRP